MTHYVVEKKSHSCSSSTIKKLRIWFFFPRRLKMLSGKNRPWPRIEPATACATNCFICMSTPSPNLWFIKILVYTYLYFNKSTVYGWNSVNAISVIFQNNQKTNSYCFRHIFYGVYSCVTSYYFVYSYFL